MPEIKERIRILNNVFPIQDRIHTVELDLEDHVYDYLQKTAMSNDVTIEDVAFMIVVESIEKTIQNT